MTKIILGGGLGGLSAGYYMTKRFPHRVVTLLEASNRVGGWLKSIKLEDGTIFEQAARTIRPQGESGINTLCLIDDLNLSDQILPVQSTSAAALNRMVYVNGKLHSLPSSLFSIFMKQTPFSKPLISCLFKDISTPKKLLRRNDESLYDFVSRRFGTEIADYLISPLLCGICGGDAKKISVKFLMESLFEMEQNYGSITRGVIAKTFSMDGQKSKAEISNDLYRRSINERWNVYTFKDGMEILPMALKENIEKNGVDIKLNTKVTNVEIKKNSVVLYTDGGQKFSANSLISSLPAECLSLLVQKGHAELSKILKNIPSASMCVVNLKYNKKLQIKEGFGFLVAPKENLPILGVIYDSCCFPQGNNTVLTVMMGGFKFDKYFNSKTKDEEAYDIAVKQIKNILNITEIPDSYKVNILTKCIPQYIVGHNENLTKINDYIKSHNLPLGLCGASYYGVGVNDVIMSAKIAIKNMQ